MFKACIFGVRGGGEIFLLKHYLVTKKMENINVVSLGTNLGGIEVGKYALFISNVISCFSFLIFLRHFYVKYHVDELHSGRNKSQLSLLDLFLCYFSIVLVKPSM